MADWKKIKTEYITDTSSSYRKLAKKYNISLGSLCDRAKREKWAELKKQNYDKSVTKQVAAVEEKQIARLVRIQNLTDTLLDKLEQAVNELDIQLVKHTEKVKEIEYNNEIVPDKPTKEIINETEEILEVRSIIDRKGAELIANAITKIKDIQMIKSQLDIEEQKARIANLKKQAEADTDKDINVEVSFEGSLDDYSK